MENKNYNIIEYYKLTKELLLENNNKIIGIEKDGIIVYFNLKIKTNSKNLIVFSNGALNLSKSKPPVFSRSSWANDFNASCIYIDYATIHNTNMTVGWGIGTQDRYYLEDYVEIIELIID